MKQVAIVGVGQLPFKARYIDKSYKALAVEATKTALDDAKVAKEDIGAVVHSIYCELMMRQQAPDILIQDHLGLRDKPSMRVALGAATGGFALYGAYGIVASGLADIVLLLGVQKGQDFYSFDTASRGDGLLKGFSISSDTTWIQPLKSGGVSSLQTVLIWLPHLSKYGGPTPEQVAKVSVKNHKNALLNPNAQLKMDLSVEEVLNSRIIAWPTTMYECCLYSEGATALILANENKAREITDTPIWIAGCSTCAYYNGRLEPSDLGRMTGVSIASKRAYEMAGIKNPFDELDVIELHDIISAVEVIAYEELGLCQLGDGGKLVDEGIVYKDGKLPVNPSGGRVACGHVGGVSEIYSIAEIVFQLREEAGDRQVQIRRGKGLIECIDGAASGSAIAILERER